MPIPTAILFEFLDRLRESGETNMYGAAPYLQNEFEMSIREARVVLDDWMKTFERRMKTNGQR